MKYTTQHIQALFEISHQTVKNWCSKDTGFYEFLSPSARPESNHARQFTEDDLRVFALAVEMKKRGATHEDIRYALQTGQRGELPQTFDTTLAPTPTLVSKITEMQEHIELMNSTIQNLQAEGNKKDGQIALLKEQLAEAQKEIRQLERENTRLSDHD